MTDKSEWRRWENGSISIYEKMTILRLKHFETSKIK